MVRVSATRPPPGEIAAVNLLQIAEAGSEDRNGRDGGGFGAQSAGAEAGECDAGGARGFELVVAPAAFGTDAHGCAVARLRGGGCRICIEQDFRAFALDEIFELRWRFDRGDDRSAALFDGFEDDFLPAVGFGGVAFGAEVDAVGDEGDDRADAELGRFLEDELEFVELDDRHGEVDRCVRLTRRDLVADAQHGAVARNRFHRRLRHLPRAVEDLDLLALAYPDDADGVVELFAFHGYAGGDGIDEDSVAQLLNSTFCALRSAFI